MDVMIKFRIFVATEKKTSISNVWVDDFLKKDSFLGKQAPSRV